MTLLLLTFQYCGDFTQQVAARRPHSAVRPPKPFFIEEAQSFFSILFSATRGFHQALAVGASADRPMPFSAGLLYHVPVAFHQG